MKVFAICSAAAVMVTTAVSTAAAQIPPPPPPPPPGVMAATQPPRDASGKPGTAIIRGRVVAADSGQPLRKVFIRATSPELREGHVTSTDAEGRYELKELPAGRYTLNASKGSYVALTYGQLRPFEPGKPLEVADAQVIEKVDFILPRGAVITGRVVDEFGEPVADAQVSPMRYVNQGGRRRLQPSGRSSMTNDVGEYRIFGLSPGSYYISATMRGAMGPMMNAQSDDRSGYAPTYFPGTSNAAEAQRLTVGLAQMLTDINVPLIPTRIATVTGVALDSQGRPLTGGMVMVVQRQGAGGFSMNTGGPIRPDGTFTINGLAPGDYTLQANSGPGGGFDTAAEFATAEITVAGDDISGIRLVSIRSSSVTGRIVFSDARAASSVKPGLLRLMAAAKNPEDFSPFAGGQGRVTDDFSFEIKARPAHVILRVNSQASGWMLKSVKLNGTDVTDSGFDIRPNEDLTGLEVEMTNLLTELSGGVTNARSEPVTEYSVIVFPRDRDLMFPGSRFVRTARPDQGGRFKISGLPPGAYNVIALDYIDPADDASDPEFLDRIREKASSLSLGDGETKSLDLRLTTSS